MGIQPATPEQIDVFMKAAMDRYQQLGVSEQDAEVLLQAQLMKYAESMGFTQDQPQEQYVEKTAAESIVDAAMQHLMAKGLTEKQAEAALAQYLDKQASYKRIDNFKARVVSALGAVRQ